MRELSFQEMEQVCGGSSTIADLARGNVFGSPHTDSRFYSSADKSIAVAYLATIQPELDALDVNGQIWSSLSGS